MEKFTKDISEIIIAEIKSINNKVRGLNFLELLKVGIIEKLIQLIGNRKLSLEQLANYEYEIREDTRDIKISINYFLNSISKSKKILSNDSLFLSFNEVSNFDIYKDENKFKSIILYKNTGISLPKDTVINSKYNKKVLLVEIINKETEQTLTK